MITEEKDRAPEVFRGHLVECLAHFGEALGRLAPKFSKRTIMARQPMAQFCGVADQAVGRWLSGRGALPIGELMFKCTCFLNLLGYRIIEFENLPKVNRVLFELVGFSVLTAAELTKLFGYSEVSTVLKMLRGQMAASENRKDKMWEIMRDKKGELEQKRSDARQLYAGAVVTIGAESFRAVIKLMEVLLILLEEPAPGRLSLSDQQIINRLNSKCLDLLSERRME